MKWTGVFAVTRVCVAAVALIGLMASLPAIAVAQTLGGNATGTSVSSLTGTTTSAVSNLPSTGGYDVADAQTFGVAGVVDAQWLTSHSTGSTRGNPNAGGSSQSVSEVENVSILNGLISAANVTAIANSVTTSTGAVSNSSGSGFVGLLVNGTSISGNVAANTRIDLLGVGYVVLNEVTTSGDGVNSTAIKVNMIHVYQLGGGEIVVGSASSSVSP